MIVLPYPARAALLTDVGVPLAVILLVGIGLCVLLLSMAAAVLDKHRARRREQTLKALVDVLTGEEHAKATQLLALREVLDHCAGGLHKRVDEIREVAECLLRVCPDLFHREPGLLYWLEATDDFLCALEEASPSLRRPWFPPRSGKVFDDIRGITERERPYTGGPPPAIPFPQEIQP